MKHIKIFYSLLTSIFLISMFYSCDKDDSEADNSGTITDIDGNTYKTIKIGTQTWMQENLKTTKYKDASPVQLITDDSEWIYIYREKDKDAYCWYENDRSTYGNTYGALYNWYAVESDNICPAGWHLPTYDEWSILIDYLGGESIAGGKMKEAGQAHWISPNEGATNEYGFTALPGGDRPHVGGSFNNMGYYAGWWSQSKPGETSPRSLSISFNHTIVSRGTTFSTYGHSVRCIKD